MKQKAERTKTPAGDARRAVGNRNNPKGLSQGSSQSSAQVLKRLLSLAAPRWKALALATFFLFTASAMQLVFPAFVQNLVDKSIEDGLGAINQTAFVLIVVFLVQSIAVGLRTFLFQVAGQRVVADLRKHTYARLIQQEIGFFDQRKTGELISRLASDTTVVQGAVTSNLSMALQNTAVSIGGVVMMVAMSPSLTLLMLVAVPPVMIGAVIFGRLIRRLSKQSQDALALANDSAEESIAGIRTVRSFSKEARERGRYDGNVENAFDAIRKQVIGTSIFEGVVSFAVYAALALIVWYGGRLVFLQEMTIGGLVAFLIYTLMIAGSVGTLGRLYGEFMRAAGASERVFELIDRVPLIPLESGEKLEKVDGLICFEDLNFSYPTRPDIPTLKDINLTIRPGEIVALVGPSGSGKSTIANLIPRFYDPESGSVTVDGRTVKDLDATWLRNQIGTVSQEPTLFSMSVYENISYGRESCTRDEVVEAAKIANAHDFISSFPDGYETEVGERGVQLSGGQKQRIAIARAVLKDPRILILDEATSALDAESEQLVKEALDRLMQGRTTLVIAHRLSTVKDADRVVVLESGRIVEMGTHEELMALEEGVYRRLVEHQFVTAEGVVVGLEET